MTSDDTPTNRDDQPAELSRLVGAMCDNSLSAAELARLNEMLAHSAEARRFYLRYVALHSSLATAAGSYARSPFEKEVPLARLALEEDAVAGHGRETAISPRDGGKASTHRRHALPWLTAAAAAIFLIAVASAWREREISQSPAAVNNLLVAADSPRSGPKVADITKVSSNLRWLIPNESFSLASQVRAGQSLTLEAGAVELTYSSGTTLLLTGPSEFVVAREGGTLRRGELVARVSEAGHGFTVETPTGKVIDLGTEFGLVVDDFGVSEVRVFEGKVQALPAARTRSGASKIELTTGRALQWTRDRITPFAAGRRGDLRRSVEPVSQSLEDDRGLILLEAGVGDRLSSRQWKMLGDVTASPEGVRFGLAEGGRQSFLIATQQLEPARGAVSISCDVEFDELGPAGEASFSILTRSADERGKTGAPWQNMLARGVRCSLKSDGTTGDGMLEAGTKYEGDRELSNIAWRGFMRPQKNVAYHLEMRDDGLSVSFTASAITNPSATKTVTCRSLFRGDQSFVAFEGPTHGAVRVANIRITQRGGASADDSDVVSESRDLAVGIDRGATVDLVGDAREAGFELQLRDDFATERLDATKWLALGDVVVRDGQAQLGLPNDEQHIDTWRPRPFVLTRQEFAPRRQPVLVVGQAMFSPNFLHGYGGSFAVVTRAEPTYSSGPGWQASILRQGLRANFWPAALGQEHSLELFQSTAPDSATLLAAEGFPIRPASRKYWFRVLDDGRSATLTLIDAVDPTSRKTISHATLPSSRETGLVGLEGCWGSPMLVDWVEIYEQAAPATP